MKVLLDHCVPRTFAKLLTDHHVLTTSSMGWQELSNGKLLNAAREAGFASFITTDANMQYQQNAAQLRDLIVIVMLARSNRLADLSPLAPRVLAALQIVQPGTVFTVDNREGQA